MIKTTHTKKICQIKFDWMVIFWYSVCYYIFQDEYLNIGDNLWYKMFNKIYCNDKNKSDLASVKIYCLNMGI